MSDHHLPFDDDVELRFVRRPPGSHRSKSTGTPGAERDLLRDSTGALLGPTESFPVDLDELRKALARRDATGPARQRQVRSPGKQMAVDAAADVAYVVAREAIAQVYRLVIAPKARAKWAELKESRRQTPAIPDESGAEVVVADREQIDAPSTAVDERPAITVMNSVEFRQRLALMLAAENFAAEQRRLLSAVQMSDEADLPPQLVDAMRLVLEENTASLDDVSLQLLIDFLVSRDAELVAPTEVDHRHLRELEMPEDGR